MQQTAPRVTESFNNVQCWSWLDLFIGTLFRKRHFKKILKLHFDLSPQE